MTSARKFCLKWTDFHNNISTTFNALRDDQDFADVTLTCEDGEQMEAHKVILSASSPVILNMLRRNKHSHPLIYMHGIKARELVNIVDFMYHGQVNILQDNLNDFLAIAEELQVKGLTKLSKDGPEEVSLEQHLLPMNQEDCKPLFLSSSNYMNDLSVDSVEEKPQNCGHHGRTC